MANQSQESLPVSTGPRPDPGRHRQDGQSIPVWVASLTLLGAALLSAGAVISLWRPGMLASPNDAINSAVKVYAGYTAARDAGLAALLVVLLSLGARRALGQLLVLIGLIQLFDTAIDLVEQRWTVAPGVFVLGILFLLAAARLCGAPFWRRAVWI
jgi:hypothetical protein